MISFYFKRSHKCRRIIRENTKFTSCSKNINFSPVLFMKRSQTLFSNFLKIKCAINFFASYIVLFLLQIKQIISFSKLKISENYVIVYKFKNLKILVNFWILSLSLVLCIYFILFFSALLLGFISLREILILVIQIIWILKNIFKNLRFLWRVSKRRHKTVNLTMFDRYHFH